MAGSNPTIDLYSNQTPNGLKITATLEELGLPYNLHKINILENTQKEPWFLEINPNGRIPAMTDTFSDGKKICLFESGAIMRYLVERYDKDQKISYPPGSREHYEVDCWLFFLNAGVGPMQGQATHFKLYAPGPDEYALFRYTRESKRLHAVLNDHLAQSKSGYLVGDRCTLADLAHYPWIACSAWCGLDVSEFPHLQAWQTKMETRPAIAKARTIPEPYRYNEIAADAEWTKQATKPGREWFKKLLEAASNEASV